MGLLRVVAVHVGLFYALYFFILAAGFLFLTGGLQAMLQPGLAPFLIVLLALLAPAALASAMVTRLVRRFRPRFGRLATYVVAVGGAYISTVAASLIVMPRDLPLEFVLSPLSILNLLAVVSGVTYSAWVLRASPR